MTDVDNMDFCGELCMFAENIINQQRVEIDKLKRQLSLAEDCINEIDDALYRGTRNDWAEQAIETYNNKKETKL